MPRLVVFVTGQCFGCAEALRLAKAAATRFPAVAVRVVDLEREPEARPESLVAVPTYMLDGQVVSLGNPRESDLFGQLERSLATGPAEESRHGAP